MGASILGTPTYVSMLEMIAMTYGFIRPDWDLGTT